MRGALAAIAIVATMPACSLILDFSESAAPADASIDGPYTKVECDYKEPNNTLTAPAVVLATDRGPAAICSATAGVDDHDFYQFTVTGTTLTIAVAFMNRQGGDLDLKVYDQTGIMIGQSRSFGDGEMITCPGLAPSCPA